MAAGSSRLSIPYKTTFVVNPAGGGGAAGRIWPRIAELLKRSGVKFAAYYTRGRGEATRLAEKAVAGGAELIVAVGGDGTVNEVVNGIDPGQIIFGILPLGTGNGFARSCSIPGQWERALAGLSSWPVQRVDLGHVNGRRFLNVVGIGFDAAVAEMARDKYAQIKGFSAYLAAFFDELMKFDHFGAHLLSSDFSITEDHTLLAVVANGKYYGGRFAIAPQAEINDGLLDLVLVRKRNSPETTLLAAKVLAGKHLEDSAVCSAKVDRILVCADHPVPVHIDGEVTGSLPLEISIKPLALKILAPL